MGEQNKSNVKNILSIDMDYILSPCINLYNDIVFANENPEKIWENISKLRNADKHISYSDENLQYIFNVFTKALKLLKDKRNIKFALNHDAILFDLASSKYENSEFNLYNIDHHHDIYYSSASKKEVDSYDVSGVANWVWYLDKHKKIKQYNWICNENSFFPEGEVHSIGKMDAYTKDKLPEILNVKSWDYIFVCNSPHWFPRTYDVFFNMLIDIYQNFTGNKISVEENIFCPNGISHPYPYNKK